MIKGSFESIKAALRQTKDGMVISFVIHPMEISPDLAAAPIGTRFMIGYAEIADDESMELPVKGDRSKAAKLAYAALSPEAQARVRSVRLCKDPEFQAWIAHHPVWGGKLNPSDVKPTLTEEGARGYILLAIGATSRSQIEKDEEARHGFMEIEAAYKEATGRTAERHE